MRCCGILTKYIDINQIKRNIELAKYATGKDILAVVKANCYSNGSLIATFIEDSVAGFAVANVFEGVRLRELGVTKPILALSFCKKESELCKIYNISASISDPKNYVPNIKYHIAFDTGMNRGGVKGICDLMLLLHIMNVNDIEGIYSHIYSQNDILTASQIAKFDEAVFVARRKNHDIKKHIFASNYKLNLAKCDTDMIRLGIGLYQNAVAVTSNILQIKHIKKGENVGYDGEFCAPNDMKIALCEGGYFDGIIRRFTGQKVAIGTDFCKVIGKISMDSHIVDVTEIAAKPKDKTVIFDTDKLSFDERAKDMNISAYELMTLLKGRFEYVYFN